MARVVKAHEHAIRRKEILDVARRHVTQQGYAQMSIQDLLDDLGISKGAFYHYFDSKQALLEALVERLVHEAVEVITPTMEDPALSALEKFHRYFDTLARWKTARKDYLISLYRVWYTDDNAVVRQRLLSLTIERVAPLLAVGIRQGIDEGVFTTPFPNEVGAVVLALIQGLSDALGSLLLSERPEPGALARAERTAAAYTDALERVLGARPGSLKLVDARMLEAWLGPAKPARAAAHRGKGVARPGDEANDARSY